MGTDSSATGKESITTPSSSISPEVLGDASSSHPTKPLSTDNTTGWESAVTPPPPPPPTQPQSSEYTFPRHSADPLNPYASTNPWGTSYPPSTNPWGTSYPPSANPWGTSYPPSARQHGNFLSRLLGSLFRPRNPTGHLSASVQINEPDFSSSSHVSYQYNRCSTNALIEKLDKTNPSNTKEIATTQLALINRYHRNVLLQAQDSFRWALIAAGIGLLFFLAAISFLLLQKPGNLSLTSLMSGSLVEVISAINFFLYGRASGQLSSFHLYLDRTHRFLMADSVCNNISQEDIRDKARSEIIQKIMDISIKEELIGKK